MSEYLQKSETLTKSRICRFWNSFRNEFIQDVIKRNVFTNYAYFNRKSYNLMNSLDNYTVQCILNFLLYVSWQRKIEVT